MIPQLRAPRLALFTRLLLAGMPALILSGQIPPGPSSNDGITPAMLEPGTPAGSYVLSGFDTVNIGTGHVNFTLPLAMAYGRGGMKVPLVWNQQGQWTATASPAGCNLPNGPPYCSTWSIVATFGPRYSNYANIGGVLELRQSGANCGATGSPLNSNWWQQSLTTVYYVAPDGTETEFVDTATGGAVETNASYASPGTNRGTSFRSVDGSGAVATTASAVVDNPIGCGNGAGPIGGTMTLRDGTTYTFSTSPSYAGYAQQIEDRNGNVIGIPNPDPYAGETVTDALNRSITASVTNYYPAQEDTRGRTSFETITYPGYDGATRQVVVSSSCTVALEYLDNQWQCTSTSQPSVAQVKTASGSMRPMLRGDQTVWNYDSLFPFMDTSGWFVTYLPFEIALPDGTAYEIYYNSYGDVSRVELPTGGAYEYDYLLYYNSSTIGSPLLRRIRPDRV